MSTTRRLRKALTPVAPSAAAAWMAARGWQPFGFQHDVWRAMGEGRSGLCRYACVCSHAVQVRASGS